MAEVTYWQNLVQRQVIRRRLLRASAQAGVGLAGFVLTGCSSSSRHTPAGSASSSAQAGSAAPRTGGTLNTYLPVNPPTLDAQVTKSIPGRAPTGHVMSRLFRHKTAPDPKVALGLELENDLATSAESPDGVTWSIKLRTDAKFQDIPPVRGHAVEAEDVKATFTRALTVTGSAAVLYLPMVDAAQIETPAPNTAVFKLKYPYGLFPQDLAGAVAGWIYPREALAGSYDPAEQVIGSGPFILQGYTPDAAITYKTNPDWFERGRPYIGGERTAIIPDTVQQLAQFTAGNLDGLSASVNDLDTAKRQNPKATLITAPSADLYQIYGHLDDPASAFQDIRIRQALSMAIDREAIGKAVFGGQYHNNGVLPLAKGKWALAPEQLGTAARSFTYNPTEAKKLVAASGAQDRFQRFVYPVHGEGPQFETIGQMLNPMLNAAGFKTQLVSVDYATEYAKSGKGIIYGYYPPDTLVFGPWKVGTSVAEEILSQAFLPGGGSNHPHVDDAQLTAMITKMLGVLDETERLQQAHEIQRYIADKMYSLSGIPTGDLYTLVQPRVRGYTYSLAADTAGTETYAKLWLES